MPILEALDRPEWTLIPIELPTGFEGFAAAARAVAEAGLPPLAPAGAVWCLVAAMTASKGALGWARTLLRLTGDFRCGDCDCVFPITAGLGCAIDPDSPRQDPATVADSAGFRPAPSDPPVPGRSGASAEPGTQAEPAQSTASGTPAMPDRSGASAEPGTQAEPAQSTASGTPAMPGRSGASAGFTLHPVPTPADLRIPTPCEALVKMPDGGADARPAWLARLKDGGTILATGDDTGAVLLRDPLTRKAFGELWRRDGRRVTGMAFADDLVVVYGDLNVDVWSPRAVSGERSSMAPKPANLGARGHSEIVAVCPGTDLGYRKPFVLADRHGTVSLWETFGVRLNDPLPPDPAHRDVFAVAASGGLVVTAGRADANLRIWHPVSSTTSLVPLESAPQWITFTGTILTVGLAGGPASFSVR